MQLNEKMIDIEELRPIRRSSEALLKEALMSKQDELPNYILSLYVTQEPTNITNNKIVETQHNLNVENKILNFFIFVFTIFIILQFSLISIVKLDLEFPIFESLNHQIVFNYSYLVILTIGKTLTYLFLITFLMRCYIGMRLFRDKSHMLLFELWNMQFMGFLSQSMLCIGIITVDYFIRSLLERLNLLDDSIYYNELLAGIKFFTNKFDFLLYGVLAGGLVLSAARRLHRIEVQNVQG